MKYTQLICCHTYKLYNMLKPHQPLQDFYL